MKNFIIIFSLALFITSCASNKEQPQALNFDYRIYDARIARSFSIDTDNTKNYNNPYSFAKIDTIRLDSSFYNIVK